MSVNTIISHGLEMRPVFSSTIMIIIDISQMSVSE